MSGGQGLTDVASDLHLTDLKIRTKEKEVVRFTPNGVQEKYLAEIAPGWKGEQVALRGQREILLKARQFGFSTLILALYFLDTIQNPHTQTVVIAHDADSTERIFQMVQRFYNSLPEDQKPHKKYANRREFLWDEIDSYFFVGTAGSGEFGRGGTINNVHGSEVAFWPDAESIVSGLFNSVPSDGNIILETTANGMNNWFHDEYQNAKKGNSAFTPRFYGWWEHAEYRRAVPAGFRADAEEEKLARQYGLDEEQLAWRRAKKLEQRSKFVQEYPANAQEAFVSSGGRVLHEFIAEPSPYGHLYKNNWVPPAEWRHYLIIDPGRNTFAALFAAQDDEGAVWLYGEYYGGEKPRGESTGERWLPSKHFELLNGLKEAYCSIAGPIRYRTLMDPAGWNVQRAGTVEGPSWEEELVKASRRIARETGRPEWFFPSKANNSDGLALRPNEYFASGLMWVGESLSNFQWEAQRWVTLRERTGQYADERPVPEDPIDRWNHLQDCLRYLCSELGDPPTREPDPLIPGSLPDYWRGVRAGLDGKDGEGSVEVMP